MLLVTLNIVMPYPCPTPYFALEQSCQLDLAILGYSCRLAKCEYPNFSFYTRILLSSGLGSQVRINIERCATIVYQWLQIAVGSKFAENDTLSAQAIAIVSTPNGISTSLASFHLSKAVAFDFASPTTMPTQKKSNTIQLQQNYRVSRFIIHFGICI